MLTRLYATNYRSLVNFEFKPNSKQLIIGRNGTGKSTVFDILALLRDFGARGLSCEGRLGGRTRTSWQKIAEQRFELDVKGNGGLYRYSLIIDEFGEPLRPRVKQETLEFNGNLLLRFVEGQVSLFKDSLAPSRSGPSSRSGSRSGSRSLSRSNGRPTLEFPLDWHRSGLAAVEADALRKDSARLSWFKIWLNRVVQVQINPWVMSARSEVEARYPNKD